MLKYRDVAQKLQEAIRMGRYKPGDYLPPEKELCAEFGVSRITIKRAVDEVVAAGLLVKRRGAGTTVKALPEEFFKNSDIAGQFNGFVGTFKGREVSTRVLRFDVVHPDAKTAENLQMNEEDFVYEIIRLRILEGMPLVIEYTKMPIMLIPGLRQETLEKSIYSYIEGDLSLKIQSAHRTVRALMPTEEEANLLEIEGVPILEVEQVAFLDDGRPFEYSISHHRGDKGVLHSVSVR